MLQLIGEGFRMVMLFIIGVLITIFFCMISHVILFETIVEVGYSTKAGKRARKILKNTPCVDRIFLWKLASNASKNKIAVGFYSLLNTLNCIVFLAGIVANCLGLIFRNSDVILYGGMGLPLGWILLMALIAFVPDLIFQPSERKRYTYDDPAIYALCIVFFGSVIIGAIIMLLKQ